MHAALASLTCIDGMLALHLTLSVMLLCAACSIKYLDLSSTSAQAGIVVPDITTPLVSWPLCAGQQYSTQRAGEGSYLVAAVAVAAAAAAAATAND
jgi:hypothetical protein